MKTQGLVLLTAMVSVTGVAPAQPYPQRPVRIIVNVSAGGGVDIVARIAGSHMSAVWGQTFVVDNRTGASGIVGTLKETFAMASSLVEGMKSDDELVRSICSKDEVKEAQQSLRAHAQEMQGTEIGAIKAKLHEVFIAWCALKGLTQAMPRERRVGAR